MKYEMMTMTPEEEALIKEKIREHDLSLATSLPDASDEEVVLKVTDGAGTLCGGLIVSFDVWGAMELVNLWIDERLRGRGLGSLLICEAERIARERGCRLSIVSTWSYQARPLYEKHGYVLCSTVTDWPKGHDSYYLTKKLDADRTGYVSTKTKTDFKVSFGGAKEREAVHAGLHAYNCSRVPRLHPHVYFKKILVDENGKMIAGCSADLDSIDITVLEALWVDEPCRLKGAGSFLLGEVERAVKEAGGIFIVAYVYDREAGFFFKNGYVSCGAIEDHPKGHRRYAMKKIL